jgi:hypothetical protein
VVEAMKHGYFRKQAYRVSDTFRVRIRIRYAADTYPWSIGFFIIFTKFGYVLLIRISVAIRVSASMDTAQPNNSPIFLCPCRPNLIPHVAPHPRPPSRRIPDSPHAHRGRLRPQLGELAARRPPATSICPGPSPGPAVPARHSPSPAAGGVSSRPWIELR